MKILAITGTIGAGKGTLVDFLKEKEGYAHFSVSDFLTKELKEMELLPTRDNMANLANDIRRKFGPAHLIELLLKEAQKSDKPAIIESIRTLGEVKFLKTNKIPLLAVDADHSIRYGRILKRKSSKDNVSFEQFVTQEKKESRGKDLWEQNLPACIKKAQYLFFNNGAIEDFHEEIGLYMAMFQPVSL